MLLRNADKLKSLVMGERLTDSQRASAPRELLAEPPASGHMPHIFGTYRTWYICPELHDWLVELEPGVHDFLPVQVKTIVAVEGNIDHGTYYLLMPPPVVDDAVVIAETEFWGDKIGGRLSPVVESPVVIRASAAAGRHLWSLAERHGHQVICSDELWSRIKTAKLRGLSEFKKVLLKPTT